MMTYFYQKFCFIAIFSSRKFWLPPNIIGKSEAEGMDNQGEKKEKEGV